MAGFNDFAPGQRVAHITMGDGTVTAVEDGRVIVRYDRWKSKGEYDRRWFELHPTFLFGRSEEEAHSR